jgi:hypothetical protein
MVWGGGSGRMDALKLAKSKISGNSSTPVLVTIAIRSECSAGL